MFETEKNTFTSKKFLLGTVFDPVLIYTVLVMMSIMYHYRSSLTAVYGIAAFVIGWLVFRVFDFIQKHKLLGTVAYIGLLTAFFWVTGQCIAIGRESYPISWGLWFLTPQDALEYSSWYTIAIFLLFMIFMASVIYYFTRIRYRIFMGFLIFIIPFAIYGKEYEKMPTAFIILLAVGYVLLMVYFRVLKDDMTVVIVDKQHTYLPVAVYAVLFAAAAALVPKPAVEADRTVLETLINADQFTDRLVSLLNVFRDSTEGEQFRGNTDDSPLYYARSPEPLRLKTSTFSTYDFSKDSWSIQDMDSRFKTRYTEMPVEIASPVGISEAILTAASEDRQFAEKYGLTEFVGQEIKAPEQRELNLFTVLHEAQFAPVPQFAVSLDKTTRRDEIALIRSGLVYAVDDRFGGNERFTFTYSTDTFFYDEGNKRFIDAVTAVDDYERMLEDASECLESLYYDIWLDDDEYSEKIDEYRDIVDFDIARFEEYDEYLLDYGNNERIYELAQTITAGFDSDYDKAKAIEAYFYDSGYIYDQSYRKNDGANAETFLFDSKTGVCYEYATSMVLLARAAGIHARYCEGYNMTEQYRNDNYDMNYVVTSRDAHGFPELYIKGYGWVSFEPTVTDLVITEEKNSATDLLAKAGIMIIVASMLILIMALLYPTVSHRLFLLRSRRRSPNDAVIAAMRRICRIYGIGGSLTSHEVQQRVAEISAADISAEAVLFDKAAYGGVNLGEKDKEAALNDYSAAYDSYVESKRKRRKRAVKAKSED